MIYVVTALPWEARPVIERYNLKRDDNCKFFPMFKGSNMCLIVSGIGKMASAIAAAYLLSGGNAGQDAAIVNIGVCGAVKQQYPIGTPVLIHKITDHETGRDYYSDILLEHPFAEGSVETHNQIVRREYIDSGQSRVCTDLWIWKPPAFSRQHPGFVSHQIYVIKS